MPSMHRSIDSWQIRPALVAMLVGILGCGHYSFLASAAAHTIYQYRDAAGIRNYTNRTPTAAIPGTIESVRELTAEPAPPSDVRTKPHTGRTVQRRITAVHRGIALFRPKAGVDADLARLDRLIETASERLPPASPESRGTALQLLSLIHDLIGASDEDFSVYIDAHDCRRSLLYAAIGEALGLPISLAAAPGHLLVHYRLPDGNAIYWETTVGQAVAPDSYVQHYRLSAPELNQSGFLQPLPPKAVLARFHRERADAAKRDGDLNAAERHYSESIRLYDGDHVSYVHRGSVRVHLHRFDEAAQDFQRALTIHPDEPVTHYNIGSLLAQRRQFAAALTAVETAIRLKPDYQKAIDLRDQIRMHRPR